MHSTARRATTITVALGVVAGTFIGTNLEGHASGVVLSQRSTTTETTTMLAAVTSKHFSVHAFDINADADDLIPAPNTEAGTPSPGDQSVVNDQLTSTSEHGGSFSILGFDSGTCVYTRTAPDGQSAGSPFDETIEHCLATAQFAQGTITASGVIVAQGGASPERTEFTVLGGTGAYAEASGTMTLTFGKDFNTYAFSLH